MGGNLVFLCDNVTMYISGFYTLSSVRCDISKSPVCNVCIYGSQYYSGSVVHIYLVKTLFVVFIDLYQ